MNTHTNVVQLFYKAVNQYPTHTAIVSGNERISYTELYRQVQVAAKALSEAGLRRGDRVLVFVPMGIPLYRTVLALFHIGATAVFLDEWVSRSRLEVCCRMADCRGFVGVFKARLYAWFSPSLRRVPIRLGTSLPRTSNDTSIPMAMVDPDEVALITFTTGSTGIPKAAKRTHRFLHAQFQALIDTLSPQAWEVDVTILPIVLLLNLGVGATSVIVPYKAGKTSSRDIPNLWRQLARHAVSRITASPYFVTLLAEYALETGHTLPGLKRIVTGGAPVFPDEAKQYRQAFPATDQEIVYGSTEAEPISSVTTEALIAAGRLTGGLLVGEVYRGCEVRLIPIRDEVISCDNEEAFEALTVAQGEIGEIVVAGDHVLNAYFNNEVALRRNKIFIGEKCWHRTGDSGYIGMDGRLYLTGRCSALIYFEGSMLSPFICEYWMRSVPGVRCGTLIQTDGRLVAAIETLPRADQKSIARALYRLDLPAFRIQWMPQIPRDPRHRSKIDYELLRQQLGESSG